MSPAFPKLQPEDWGRLISYGMGVTWAIVFAIWTASTYVGVISQTAVHAWSFLMGGGCLLAFVGTVTRRDLKVELSGIYLVLVGAVLYLTAQIGFPSNSALFSERLPFLIFIAWHLSLLLPRLLGLEAYRRSVRIVARGVS